MYEFDVLTRYPVPLLRRARHALTRPARRALLRHAPDLHSRLLYREALGVWPSLDHPRTFNEKLTRLMLDDRGNPLRTRCTDKYAMRAWVEELGLGHMLPRLYAVWEHLEDVDLRELPERFFLKCSHGCGFNIACRDKGSFDLGAARLALDCWMQIDYSLLFGELQYAGIPRRILCEEYLDDRGLPLPVDYKAYTFHGRVHTFAVGTSRELNGQAVWEWWDADWKRTFPYYAPRAVPPSPPPPSLTEMIEAAEVLGAPFPFVRIDFYDIDGRARLGEMTFTPVAAHDPLLTAEAQRVMGTLLELPPPRRG